MVDHSILIVEDEKTIRRLLRVEFEKEGYTVVTAESGEEALAILEKQHLKVLFLDLKLPGMDGVRLCRQIKDNQAISIVYAVTGYASMFLLNDCIEAGFDDYFIKPVKTGLLLKAAGDAFEKLDRWSTKSAMTYGSFELKLSMHQPKPATMCAAREM